MNASVRSTVSVSFPCAAAGEAARASNSDRERGVSHSGGLDGKRRVAFMRFAAAAVGGWLEPERIREPGPELEAGSWNSHVFSLPV